MREVYSFGHLEYDRDRWQNTTEMSRQAWIQTFKIFDGDDANTEPRIRWNLAATTFFSNWINYAVIKKHLPLGRIGKDISFIVTKEL
ncbi:MAG: homoserine O-acetyltransferase/O-succinyltransferase family protein [Streptococcus sp.]